MDATIFSLIVLVGAAKADLFHFVRDYTSEEFFWTPFYSTIDCSETNEVGWTRSVSAASHGLLVNHKVADDFDWVDVKEPEQQTFLLNVNCPHADHALRQANSTKLFGSPFQWLLIDETSFNEETGKGLQSKWYWNAIKNYSVLLDAEVRMMERTKEGTILIVGAYKISMDGELIREELAEWTPAGGLVVKTRDRAAIRRWNVRGARLPGSFPITHPETLTHLEDMVDKHVDPICKVGYMLTKHFAEMINASLHLKVVYTWGVKENGSWTGMVGDLQSGVAEIGVSPAFVLKDRMFVVKYYEMITPTKAKFIFLSPPLSFSSNIFAMPFDRMVWLSSLIMVLVSCLALYMATKVERKATDLPGMDMRYSGLRDSLSDIFMLNVGAICMQGAAVEPKGPSGRIITLFLYFAYMFLYVSYSGSIVALLQSSDTSIRTFKDLMESSLSAGADDVIYSEYYFKTESEPTRKALYNKKIAPRGEKPHFLPPEEGVKKLRKGLYAYHVEASVGYSLIQKTFTEEEKCGLQEFKVSFFQTVDPLLTMRIRSPFAEHLRIGMKRIIETGLNHRALTRIYTKKPICTSKSSRFVSVGLTDCYYAFVIILYGIVLAWIVLFLERLTKDRVKGLRERFIRNKQRDLYD